MGKEWWQQIIPVGQPLQGLLIKAETNAKAEMSPQPYSVVKKYLSATEG